MDKAKVTKSPVEGRPWPDSVLSALCAELSMLVRAGVSLSDAIALLRDGTQEVKKRDILTRVHEALEAGEMPDTALRVGNAFPAYLVDMIALGYNTGRIEEVLGLLSDFYAREDRRNRTLKGAVVYPALLTAMLLGVTAVLIARVLPVFAQVYGQLGLAPPAPLTWLTLYGASAGYVLLAVLIAAALAAGVLMLQTRSAEGRARLDRLFARTFPQLSSRIGAGRFTRALSIANRSGLDTISAYTLAARMVISTPLEAGINTGLDAVNNGATLSDALGNAGVLNPLESRMLAAGFHAGTSEEALDLIASRAEDDAERRASGFVAAVEPTLVAMFSIIVGLLLLSVLLPLAGILSSIG